MSLNELINPTGKPLDIKVNDIISNSIIAAGGSFSGSVYPRQDTFSGGTASQSLNVGHSGYVISLPQATVNVTLTLPTVASVAALGGVDFVVRFYWPVASDGTHTWTIHAADATTMIGRLLNDATATAVVAAAPKTNVVYGTAGAGGETLSVSCDGTSWFVYGDSATASVFTVS